MDITEIMRGWHTLQKPLRDTVSLLFCKELLVYEMSNKRRAHIISRIRQRIRTLAGIAYDTKVFKKCAEDTNFNTVER